MKIIEVVSSNTDQVRKYVIQLEDKLVIELSYIDKNDGKDIICVPTQTLCVQGCKFCHISDHVGKLVHRNLTPSEIFDAVWLVVEAEDLTRGTRAVERTLLISYMGTGEILDNLESVYSMANIDDEYSSMFKTVRFGVATSIPEKNWDSFFELVDYAQCRALDLKVHWSLHNPIDYHRNKLMPNALDIKSATMGLIWAIKRRNLKVEMHYTLIDGITDTDRLICRLMGIVDQGKIQIPVKFISFNTKEGEELQPTKRLAEIEEMFQEENLPYEVYTPPGIDIGASCGQFLLDQYEKHNKIIKN